MTTTNSNPMSKLRNQLRGSRQLSHFEREEEESTAENLEVEVPEPPAESESVSFGGLEMEEEPPILTPESGEDLMRPKQPPTQHRNFDPPTSNSTNSAANPTPTPPPSDSEFTYAFFPKKDISVYDLCRILALTRFMITEDIYQQFPIELKQYFIQVKDGYVDRSAI